MGWGKSDDNEKKDLAEEMKRLARKGLIRRPGRTYCEACQKDFGSALALVHHAKRAH
jgi:hypothetical protein